MYSQQLQEHIQQLSEYAQIDSKQVKLLEEAMACFVGILGKLLGARAEPEGDLLSLSIRLLLISDGLSRLDDDQTLDGINYLVGLGFEQVSALTARLMPSNLFFETNPLAVCRRSAGLLQ